MTNERTHSSPTTRTGAEPERCSTHVASRNCELESKVESINKRAESTMHAAIKTSARQLHCKCVENSCGLPIARRSPDGPWPTPDPCSPVGVLTGIVVLLEVPRRRPLDYRVVQVDVGRRLVLGGQRHADWSVGRSLAGLVADAGGLARTRESREPRLRQFTRAAHCTPAHSVAAWGRRAARAASAARTRGRTHVLGDDASLACWSQITITVAPSRRESRALPAVGRSLPLPIAMPVPISDFGPDRET